VGFLAGYSSTTAFDETQGEIKTTPYQIEPSDFFRAETFIMEVYNFIDFCEKNTKILANINASNCTIKDTGNTYRVIYHWESLGLIDNNRENSDKGWRKFSVVDLAWISIVKALRNFGFSSDKIKVVKKCLNEKIEDKPSINWLEYAFCRAYAMCNGGNTYLLVLSTGRAIVTANNEININRMLSFLPDTYLTINLNKLFANALKLSKMTEKNENSFTLSEEEISVLSCIRTSGADKVNVKLKEGKITLIEKVFAGKKDDFKSLHELIGGINHGEATLKIENGKVIYIQALEKKKLKGEK
jgi:DNA-binding transcriptional MerR regulator